MKIQWSWKIAVAGILFVAICVSVWKLFAPETLGKNRGSALLILESTFSEKPDEIGILIIKNYQEYRSNASRWSFIYFGCTFGAAVLSGVAALLLKLNSPEEHVKIRNDVVAICAAVASLLITLSSIGNFEVKWRANRLAASGMENLAYERLKLDGSTNTDEIVTRIQQINKSRSAEIVGFSEEETKAERNEKDEQP